MEAASFYKSKRFIKDIVDSGMKRVMKIKTVAAKINRNEWL